MENKTHYRLFAACLIILMLASFALSFYYQDRNSKRNMNSSDTLSHEKTIMVKYDSFDRFIPQPYPVKVTDSFYIPVPANIVVDTQAIIRQYYTEYILADTIRNHELYLYIVDTLFKNRIQGRFLTYRILRPDSIIKEVTTLQAPEKSHVFAGSILGTGTFGPGIIYNRKNNYMVGLSSNILLPSPNIQASVYFKIR